MEAPPIGSIWERDGQRREVVEIDTIPRGRVKFFVACREPGRETEFWLDEWAWHRWASKARRLYADGEGRDVE